MKTKMYPFCTLSILEDEDTIYIEYCHNLEINLSSAEDIVSSRMDFAPDKKHYLIVDATNVKSVSREAKNYLLDPEYGTKNIIAAAMIAGNPVSSMLANIFIKSSKNFPSRYFAKKSDAIKWINELKNK